MRAPVATLLLVLLTACGGDDGGSTGPDPVSVGGTWQFSSSMTAAQAPITCTATGTVAITQNGNTFNGQGQQQGACTFPGGSTDTSGPVSITGGQINGSSVSFEAPFCQYQGTIEGSNRMSGNHSCTIQSAGTTYNFSGTWQTSR